jgi:hypothetical protein
MHGETLKYLFSYFVPNTTSSLWEKLFGIHWNLNVSAPAPSPHSRSVSIIPVPNSFGRPPIGFVVMT